MESPSNDTRDLSAPLLDATVSTTVVGAVFVLTRLWVRFFSTKAHSWDDYFIMGSLAASITSMALTVAMVNDGYGKPIATLDLARATNALKFSNFAILVNGFSMAFLKVSIGLSLLRLKLGKGMVWIVWGSIVLSVAVNALVLVTSLFGCRPLAAVWDKSLMPVASCLPSTVTLSNSYVQTGGNIITDLFYSFGPLYYLAKVKVSVYNKWALRGVFMVGLLATICSIAKCFELPKLRTTKDPTYDGAKITIWVRAELNAGLIAAAIPPLKSLFENVLRNVFGVRSQLRSNTGYATQHPSTHARRSRHHELEDDEIAMRSHAACEHSSNASQMHYGAGSSTDEFEDQHGVVRKYESKDGREEEDGQGGYLHGPITKTMSYTVSNVYPHKDG